MRVHLFVAAITIAFLTVPMTAQERDISMSNPKSGSINTNTVSKAQFNIPVNQEAPVIAYSSIEIVAPVEAVWKTLTDIENWPVWQSAVSEATLLGDLASDTEFVWKAGGLTFHSQLHTVEPFQAVGWTGRTMGVSAIHNWQLSYQDGVTTVAVSENLSGFLPWLMRRKFRKDLQVGMSKNLAELKAAAEAPVVSGNDSN